VTAELKPDKGRKSELREKWN